jgi:hypothetical protein
MFTRAKLAMRTKILATRYESQDIRYTTTIGRSMRAVSRVEVPLFTSAASLAPTTSSAFPATSVTSSVACDARYGRTTSSWSVGATGTTNCASGCRARMRSAAASMDGKMRWSSEARLPGRRATVVRPPSSPSAVRYRSGGPGRGRSASGWPTKRAATPVPS